MLISQRAASRSRSLREASVSRTRDAEHQLQGRQSHPVGEEGVSVHTAVVFSDVFGGWLTDF